LIDEYGDIDVDAFLSYIGQVQEEFEILQGMVKTLLAHKEFTTPALGKVEKHADSEDKIDQYRTGGIQFSSKELSISKDNNVWASPLTRQPGQFRFPDKDSSVWIIAFEGRYYYLGQCSTEDETNISPDTEDAVKDSDTKILLSTQDYAIVEKGGFSSSLEESFPSFSRKVDSSDYEVDATGLDITIKTGANSIEISKSGTITLSGTTKIVLDKDTEVEGDLKVDGKIEATGNIESEGEVKANSQASPTTLSQHQHPTAIPGPASPPTPGT